MFGKQFMYGCAYYPEHWDKKHYLRDARLMKAAGFNVIRVAEFAWWFFEPQEGQFKTEWLDEAIDIFHSHGISTIIGTPTATIPAWMAKKYPHLMAMTNPPVRRPFGVRKDYCVLQPDFERLALRIVERVARHYGHDKRIVGFQTDNEFVANRCRCDLCLDHFRQFLRRRYKTIHRLNQEYGAWFWGAMYNGFDEVDFPATDAPNPSHALDYKRFNSWVDVQHQRKQIEILRKHAPRKWITHNCMALYRDVDYFQLGSDLDFISWDSYPSHNPNQHYSSEALSHHVMWAIRQRNTLIMEKQSGPGGWMTYMPQTAPGQTAMHAWQSIARGADGISYFRWRTSISGQEQYWHGILNHDNQPRRRYHEIAEMGKQIKRVGKSILGTEPVQQVGIYNDYDQIWATEHQPQNRDNPIRFQGVMCELAEAVAPMGVDFGSFGTGSDLGRFKLLLCPPLYLCDPAFIRKLEAFVRAGGHLVLTARSGVKTINNKNLLGQALPGPLRRLAGVEVDEYSIVPSNADWQVQLPQGKIAAFRIREHLLPGKAARVIGVHRGDYMDGWPAVARHEFGKGIVWYIGTLPRPSDWRTFLWPVLSEAGVDFRDDIPQGLEVAHRSGAGKNLTFVMNHTNQAQWLRIPLSASKKLRDLLNNKTIISPLELPPYGVAVINGRV